MVMAFKQIEPPFSKGVPADLVAALDNANWAITKSTAPTYTKFETYESKDNFDKAQRFYCYGKQYLLFLYP